VFKKERLDWAMGIQSGSADIGAFFGIIITPFVVSIFGWRESTYLWAFITAIALSLGLLLTRKLTREFLQGTITTEPFQGTYIQTAVAFMKQIKWLLPGIILSGAAWGVILIYLPLLLDAQTDLSLPLIGGLVGLWVATGSLISFFYGWLSDHVGRKQILILSYLLLGICSMLVISSTILTLLIIAIIGLGIAAFLSFPALFSFISQVTDGSKEGRSFGIVFTLTLTGGTIVQFIDGILADIVGVWAPFAVLAGAGGILGCSYLLRFHQPFITQT
jgi:MFS family permease